MTDPLTMNRLLLDPPALPDALKKGQSLTLSSVPDGFDALAVADLARGLSGKIEGPAVLVHVSRDGQRQQNFINGLELRRAGDRDPAIPGLGLPALRPRVAQYRRHRAAHDDAVPTRPLEDVRGQAAHPLDHGQRARAARAADGPASPRRPSRPRPATWSIRRF